jgi:hypothetical protein
MTTALRAAAEKRGPRARDGGNEEVKLVFADRVVLTRGADGRLPRPACVMAGAFLVWPSSRRVFRRDNLLGAGARSRHDASASDRQAVGLRSPLSSGSEMDWAEFWPEMLVGVFAGLQMPHLPPSEGLSRGDDAVSAYVPNPR